MTRLSAPPHASAILFTLSDMVRAAAVTTATLSSRSLIDKGLKEDARQRQMPEPPADPDAEDDGVPMMTPPHDPSKYTTQSAKERFAVSKFYGMGPGGEWTAVEIADAMEVSERQVYRYIHESDIGKETREMLAVTEAEWRLDVALKLRKTVERLENIEQELLQQKKAVATGYETKTVQGTPTGDRNIRLPEDIDQSHPVKLPVPTDFEEVTDYGASLERVQKEKRQYLAQIANLLGLDAADRKEIDHNLASRHEEVKVVNVRKTNDDYPDVQPVDTAEGSVEDIVDGPEEVTVEAVSDAESDSSDSQGE